MKRRLESLIEEIEAQFGLTDDDGKSSVRHQFIEGVMKTGGKGFVERVRRYGATDKGEPLRMPPWFVEYLELLGDFRVHHILTSGAAQIGKTAAHSLLMADTVITGKLNSGWFYASRDSRDLNVPEQFYPVVVHWLEKLMAETGQQIGQEGDRQSTSRYQVDGTTAIFTYANSSKASPSRAGLASAGGGVVSFTANMLIFEERSQWLPGTQDQPPRRADASLIPTRPIRELGTPGAGLGIEVEIERSQYWFYPHYTCDKCGKTAPLDPKGCLLRQFQRKEISGKIRQVYLSESGRPVEWWHQNPNEPLDTAYFGCSHCGHPIRDEQRDRAWFQCRRTGVRLRNFLDDLPPTTGRRKVAICLSPLCRMTKNNLAAELIRGGVESSRAEDWQQQALGHPSENTTNSITLDMLRAAIAAPKLETMPTFTLAGCDQGRSEDWLWITDFYCPSNWKTAPISQVLETTVRVVRFGGDIMRHATPERLAEWEVHYGLIDNEPDRSDASKLCGRTVLEMADQRAGLTDAVQEGEVEDGGQAYPCWKVRNEKFLKQVLLGFAMCGPDGHPLYRLPDSWERWVGVNTERSPLRHLAGPSYDPGSGKWRRGEGNIDDLFYAAMFCEAAFYLYLVNGPRKLEFASSGKRPSIGAFSKSPKKFRV